MNRWYSLLPLKKGLKKALALMKQGLGLFERMSFRHSRKLLLVKQFVNELNSFSLRSLTACFCAGLVHFPHTDDYINTPRKDFSYRFPFCAPHPQRGRPLKHFCRSASPQIFSNFLKPPALLSDCGLQDTSSRATWGSSRAKRVLNGILTIYHQGNMIFRQRWECYWLSCLRLTVVIFMTIFHTCQAHVIWSSSAIYDCMEKGQQKTCKHKHTI